MSAKVRLAAKLPGDETINGLDHRADALAENPDEVLVGLVWLDVAKVTYDVDAGAHVPTVRVRRIEPIGALADVPKEFVLLAARLFEERTGRTPLPFDELEPEAEDEDGDEL